ncbi:MAG: FHA domain-containing protein [Oscillospiraceae bacterium]|nr:FHA domain-containing protein [Oscillospiraceae bacterium]
MNCAKCGYELLPGDNFCPLCGKKIEKEPVEPAAAPTVQAVPPAQAAAVPVSPAAALPPEPDSDTIEDLPEDVHLPEGKDDPAISQAREDFIREFVATAPARPVYTGKKRGRVLLALDLILCSLAELALIGYIVCLAMGFAPAGLPELSMVYPVCALICVVLIEVILIVAAAALRSKSRRAAKAAPVNPAPSAPVNNAPVNAPVAETAPAAAQVSAPAAPAAEEIPAQEAPVEEAPREEVREGCRMLYAVNGVRYEKELDSFPITIGRSIIDDDSVAERHFTLTAENGELFITDAGSPFGVYVNGTKIEEPTALTAEDTVFAGRVIVAFEAL